MKFNLNLKKIEENIRLFFNQLRDKIISSKIFSFLSNFIQENKITALLISVLIILVLCLLILMSSYKPKKEINTEQTFPYVLIHPFQAICEKENDSYFFSRQTKENWTYEEAITWYTKPDSTLLLQLQTDNDRKISNILEAAP